MVRKNQEWPDEGELIVGTVYKVLNYGAFAKLEEYQGLYKALRILCFLYLLAISKQISTSFSINVVLPIPCSPVRTIIQPDRLGQRGSQK